MVRAHTRIFYGMTIDWMPVLAFAATLSVAFIVALGIRWWQSPDDRSIQRVLSQDQRVKTKTQKVSELPSL
jgi:hypothetical protein